VTGKAKVCWSPTTTGGVVSSVQVPGVKSVRYWSWKLAAEFHEITIWFPSKTAARFGRGGERAGNAAEEMICTPAMPKPSLPFCYVATIVIVPLAGVTPGNRT
jgi:hypothetical protein